MKKTVLVFAAAAMMSSVVLTSCNDTQKVENSQEKVADAQEDLKRANEEYAADVDAYRRDINARIDANEATIDALKEEKKYKEGSAKDAYKMRIDELKERNRELKKKLNDYQTTNKDDWERFKAEFNHDMEEMGESVKGLGKDNVK